MCYTEDAMARLTAAKRAPRPARQPMTPLRFAWRLLLAFVHVTLLFTVLAVGAGLFVLYQYGRDLPDPSAMSRRRPAETTRIYARDGRTLLFELVDPEGGRRTVVPFERIPLTLRQATIAVEDANFYENPGVDLRGIIRAVWLNSQQECPTGDCAPVSGGSTITQQLVRNVLFTEQERTRVSFERKLREAILAMRVSQKYGKDQILAMYLNEVYYGNQAYGVEAAAQAYFGKHVWDLNIAEQTLIAGLPQSPTNLDPLTNLAGARARQKIVLDLMVKQGYLTHQQADQVYDMPVKLAPQIPSLVAPHFVFYVRQLLEQRYGPDVLYRGGLRIVTTIDLSWQAEAQRIVREQIEKLRARDATNAGVIMLSPDNQILAMVGSVDYTDESIDGQVNVTLSPRQPGSALKPAVYAAALRRGWTPATVIWDTPTEFKLADGTVYAPRNYDDAWHGPQRLRMALANSLNIPAVKAIEFVGVDQFVEQAGQMGITTFTDPLRFGLSMALGSNEVRLLDLTNVYSTLRNGGRTRPPVAILKIANSRGEVLERAPDNVGRQVLGDRGEQLAFLLTDILSDNESRTYMFGRNNVMELPDRPAAVKTGTSNDWRDSWAVGYTPDITIGVWVGNSDGRPMQEVAGSNGAGLIWRELMLRFNDGRPVTPFAQPPGVIDMPICALTGGPAASGCPDQVQERFLAGTEPKTADVTFVTVRVGGGGGCLAASYTPPAEVREVRYPVYPPEFRQYAVEAGIPQPPTERCPPPSQPEVAVAQITLPSAGVTITTTQVYVQGAARGSYVLEVGQGADPQSWSLIVDGFGGGAGLLGVWRTDGLAAGDYTLRLRVTTGDGVPVETRRTVRLQR